MASEQFDPRIGRRNADVSAVPGAEPSLGELFRRLTTDTSELVRQEILLAKTELRQTTATVARDSARVGVAAGLALAGALALTAFLVAGLGDLLNNYWLSALIVGIVLSAVGAVLARGALHDLQAHSLAPEQTAATLREDAAWAKGETREVKRELTRGD